MMFAGFALIFLGTRVSDGAATLLNVAAFIVMVVSVLIVMFTALTRRWK